MRNREETKSSKRKSDYQGEQVNKKIKTKKEKDDNREIEAESSEYVSVEKWKDKEEDDSIEYDLSFFTISPFLYFILMKNSSFLFFLGKS